MQLWSDYVSSSIRSKRSRIQRERSDSNFYKETMKNVSIEVAQEIMNRLRIISGGYRYEGVVSSQICFPLKSGGELRFGIYEDDDVEGGVEFNIDFYDGALPPMITGPSFRTGK